MIQVLIAIVAFSAVISLFDYLLRLIDFVYFGADLSCYRVLSLIVWKVL